MWYNLHISKGDAQMSKIEIYTPRPAFISNDYIEQAKELKNKILSDKQKLVSNPQLDEEKWDWRNQYFNMYLYWLFHLQYFYAKALDMSITDDTANEQIGWFSYPRNERIVLGGNQAEFNSLDKYNTTIYSKYFDRFFGFEMNDDLVQQYFDECKQLFKERKFYSCACALFPIIEHFTRKLSEYSSTDGNFTQRIALNKIIEKIPKWSGISDVSIEIFTNEYKKITQFMQDNYYKKSMQEDEEPTFICRNRLLHGIITRKVTDSDCLKLFLILRSQVYLEKVFDVAEKVFRLHLIVLNIEDRIIFGDEEYNKMINAIFDSEDKK